MDKNRIEGAAEQGELANTAKLLWPGRRGVDTAAVMREGGLYLGTPCLTSERETALP
jgi:hypothetical protein